MGVNRDPLGRSKKIAALRVKMSEELGVHLLGNLNSELEKQIQVAAGYNDFRRIENERELEAIKAAMSPYIFDKKVVVRGIVPDGDGLRYVDANAFEIQMKAVNVFLSAMNMQNKLWGLYTISEPRQGNAPARSITASMVSELRKIAQSQKQPLPVKAEVIENGQ